MSYAILTTGQGSQSTNMGLDWLEFADADGVKQKVFMEVYGYDVKDILSDSDKLGNTLYAQPAIIFVTAVIGDYLKENNFDPKYYAGFSLGELSSLYLADYIDLKTLLEMTNVRSHLMFDTSQVFKGKMAAVIGSDLDRVSEICKTVSTSSEIVVVANDNSPNQIVISGNISKVDEVSPLLKADGLKVIPLKVSGGFHSPLMDSAANEFMKYLESEVKFLKPSKPVISNYTANVYSNDIVDLLTNQIISPVKWVDTINYLNSQGIYNFIEIGSGQVLAGLVKKINNKNKCITINSVSDLEKWEVIKNEFTK